MDELFMITDKYTPEYVEGALGSLGSLYRSIHSPTLECDIATFFPVGEIATFGLAVSGIYRPII